MIIYFLYVIDVILIEITNNIEITLLSGHEIRHENTLLLRNVRFFSRLLSRYIKHEYRYLVIQQWLVQLEGRNLAS